MTRYRPYFDRIFVPFIGSPSPKSGMMELIFSQCLFVSFLITYLHKSVSFPGEINDCHSIEVSGSSNTTAGVYMRTDEFANDAPENPVWKHSKNDRYIFNTGTSIGWRIGRKDHLSNGKYYYKSNSISIQKKF